MVSRQEFGSDEASDAVTRYPDEADQGTDQPALDELDVSLREVTFCVIDLETTGMANDSRITEIGAVKVRGGEVLGEFQTLINPGVSIPDFITKLTGISDATVVSAPYLRQVFASLVEFCRDCVMVAHNARFDMGFILRAAAALGYDWPSLTVVDTVGLARRVIPRHEVVNYRLGTLAEYFSTTVDPSHRALDDARATVDVLYGLLERVGNQSVSSLEDLLQFSHTISKARRSRKTWADGLPEGPGVYFFVRDSDRGRSVLYVGTSKRIRRRVATYFTAAESRRRMDEMVALATGVEAVECHTALEAAVVELRLITAHQPPYNRRSKQPHHTWIKLTDEPVPRLSIVRNVLDEASYCGPFPGRAGADQAVLAVYEAFPLRRCVERLSVSRQREPCALAELGVCPAPCTLEGLHCYDGLVDQVRNCFAGDARPVKHACDTTMQELSSQYRYEEAGEVLQRWRQFERAMRRGARLRAVARCPQIVAARPVGPCWEIHVIRFGQLAGASVALPGDDPQRVAESVLATAKTVTPEVAGMPAGSIEETELVASWLELEGVRLLDIDGVWGWPVNTQA
ncbi:MAG: DEDD exonuclease domain-containing protein [Propionibacteriaceae bacterium]|jgi:DNA polymerase-3 subunit epsilon|nr:DEDD exonuclease domain-containing protein [Propionibacteriaceae bacterium]